MYNNQIKTGVSTVEDLQETTRTFYEFLKQIEPKYLGFFYDEACDILFPDYELTVNPFAEYYVSGNFEELLKAVPAWEEVISSMTYEDKINAGLLRQNYQLYDQAAFFFTSYLSRDYLELLKLLYKVGASNRVDINVLEYFDVDRVENFERIEGSNEIDKDTLALRIGPGIMSALRTLYMSVDAMEFFEFLNSKRDDWYDKYEPGTSDYAHILEVATTFLKKKETPTEDLEEEYIKDTPIILPVVLPPGFYRLG